jgi:hypothetical protein
MAAARAPITAAVTMPAGRRIRRRVPPGAGRSGPYWNYQPNRRGRSRRHAPVAVPEHQRVLRLNGVLLRRLEDAYLNDVIACRK